MGMKISFVEVDESKPRLFVLGGRNLHGHVHGEEWGAPRVCVVPIPAMRMRGQSLTPVDTKVEVKKLLQNFRANVDTVLFSGCETVNMDYGGQNSGSKVMTSFWSMRKMFCGVQIKMKLNCDLRVAAIIPGDSDILDEDSNVSFSWYPTHAPLAQPCLTAECYLRRLFCVHERLEFRISTRIHVRNMFTSVTAVSEKSAIQGLVKSCKSIAWELDVLQVTSESNFVERDKQRNCACAVRLHRDLRQPRHSSSLSVREHVYVNTEVQQAQLRITCIAKVMSDEVSPDRLIGGKLCHGKQCEVVKDSYYQFDTDCYCVSPACGCTVTVTSGPGPGHLPMAASSSMTMEDETSGVCGQERKGWT